MLGRDADAIFWLFRYIERSENLTILLETYFMSHWTYYEKNEQTYKNFFLIALNSYENSADFKSYKIDKIINIFLRDENHIISLPNMVRKARENARIARTNLTSELWKSINDYWLFLSSLKKKKIKENEIPQVMLELKTKTALIRGAFNGTLLRNEIYNFGSLGTLIERADHTSRVYIQNIDLFKNLKDEMIFQKDVCEIILKILQCYSSYVWLNKGKLTPYLISNFLVLDIRMPRSLRYCNELIFSNLSQITHGRKNTYRCVSLSKKNNRILKVLDENEIKKINSTVELFFQNIQKISFQLENDFKFIN